MWKRTGIARADAEHPPREGFRFLAIVCAVIAICSLASHAAVSALSLKASWGGEKRFGPPEGETLALLHSSSPGYDGIDWDQAGALLDATIRSWATPGSSPLEWEVMEPRAPVRELTFIAVSAFDLNESFLSDFRAEIVPVGKTLRDLDEADADWEVYRVAIAQYFVTWLRRIFPTIGRSDGVMVGVRAQLRRALGREVEQSETPSFATSAETAIEERLVDWDAGRYERRLLLMRMSTGIQTFSGPKYFALQRLIQEGEHKGPVMVVVLPNSPSYERELLKGKGQESFEQMIRQLDTLFSEVRIVRLDRLESLTDDKYYYDFVHLNAFGREVATAEFLRELTSWAQLPPESPPIPGLEE